MANHLSNCVRSFSIPLTSRSATLRLRGSTPSSRHSPFHLRPLLLEGGKFVTVPIGVTGPASAGAQAARQHALATHKEEVVVEAKLPAVPLAVLARRLDL